MRLALLHSPEIVNRRSAVWTPLHELIQKNDSPDGVKLLLDNNADIDMRCGVGYTALHSAAMHGRPRSARVLLERGADPTP